VETARCRWRVTEIAQIILILLDSRCPLLHYPPSLASYLSTPHIANRTRVILVLTKVDIAGPVRADAWTRFLHSKYPHLRIVQVESYTEKEIGAGQGSKKVYEPHLPTSFRHALVQTLREVHAEMLEPPERLQDHPERLKNWKPPVKREIDWSTVLNARGGQVGSVVGGATAPKPKASEISEQGHDEGDPDEDWAEPEHLTIGLIGQPNVGKSSLLNALFGVHKVKASRTPGKTKHFQTLFWTPEVRLVDCPGLVMPNFLPMETQVLTGILPISRVSAVPLCIYHAAQLLPLERIYGLTHPSVHEEAEQDKRTWRGPRTATDTSRGEGESAKQKGKEMVWTAMDILTAYALKKGWVTAKAGRPDVNRAGNAILRALAEGRIRWAFWPPGADLFTHEVEHQNVQQPGTGIWIPYGTEDEIMDTDTDRDSVAGSDDGRTFEVADGEDHDDGSTPISSDEDEVEDEVLLEKLYALSTASRFGALSVVEDEDNEEEDTE